VLLVSTPDRSSGGQSASSTRFEATVIDTATPSTSSVVVYVALTARDVPAVVALAAQSRIAVVLTRAA
jgi:hypothetical protein